MSEAEDLPDDVDEAPPPGSWLAPVGLAGGLLAAMLVVAGLGVWFFALRDQPRIAVEAPPVRRQFEPAAANPEIAPPPREALPTAPVAIEIPMAAPPPPPMAPREVPAVFGIGEAQVDVVRGAMPGYDLVFGPDGRAPQIAVRIRKRLDRTEERLALDAVRKIQLNERRLAGPGPAFGPMVPGGQLAPDPQWPGGWFAGQRSQSSIEYIPLEDVDKAAAEGKLPAMTVVPVRMAVVHAAIPLRQQVDEVRRALRLAIAAEADALVVYDGFDVRRRVVLPNGDILGAVGKKHAAVVHDPEENRTVGWADYDYGSVYRERVQRFRLSDSFGATDPPNLRDDYLPYFIRYEDALAMPLPQLVTETSRYPPVRLKPIEEGIDKLLTAGVPPQNPTAIAQRLQGKANDTDRKGRFIPRTSGDTGAAAIFGRLAFPGPIVDGPQPAPVLAAPAIGMQPAIEHTLLRFVDCDVRPGFTYEYQFRVRLLNPMHLQKPPAPEIEVKDRVLLGPWVPLMQSLTMEPESFLYAREHDDYTEEIVQAHKGNTSLLNRLHLKPNQVAIQDIRWLPEVRAAAGYREPVGAWVAVSMPVGRGEYLGRTTFVKLPLWSSEHLRYVVRELPVAKLPPKGVPREPPNKGWFLDCSTRSVLVDFEGGQVATRVNFGRTYTEDVDSELLMAHPDGRLEVKTSRTDSRDPNRIAHHEAWASWVRKVEAMMPAEPDVFSKPKDPFKD